MQGYVSQNVDQGVPLDGLGLIVVPQSAPHGRLRGTTLSMQPSRYQLPLGRHMK
jgi:hypothetical protein